MERQPESVSRYANVVNIMGSVASAFGVQISDETLDAWKSAWELTDLVDNVVDEGTAEERSRLVDYCGSLFVQGAGTELDSSNVQPRIVEIASDLRSKISDEQAARFSTKGMRAIRIADRYKVTGNTSRYSLMALAEGRVVSDMVEAVTAPSDREQPGYALFGRCMRQILEIGNHADSLADLRQDYVAGETQVPPTMWNKVRMAGVTVHRTAALAWELKWRTIFLLRPAWVKRAWAGLARALITRE